MNVTNKWTVWLLASRPATLPAAVVPVVVGSAAAAAQGAFQPLVFAVALLSSLCIQIGTNFANDLFDFKKGADTSERLGPTRVTQAGLLTPRQVARATLLTFGLAFLSGLYLVAVGGWPILLIGLLGIAAGVLYTGGPWPLGYHGLGDLFTFLFFGVIAVCGTHFVHSGVWEPFTVALSLPVACLVTAILVVNNLRDIETDRAARKMTLAVRMGKQWTKGYYAALIAASFFAPLIFWATGRMTAAALLPWLASPLAVAPLRTVFTEEGRALNAALKSTGQLHLLFGLLYAVALLVQGG